MEPTYEMLDGTPDISPFLDRNNEVGPAVNAGPIEKSFFAHKGRLVHKWHHYLPLYDRYFAPFRPGATVGAAGVFHPQPPLGRAVRMLEIGVSRGGSLEMWRNYFGPEAILFGIDIDPSCAEFDGEHGNQIRIGSQADPDFLQRVVEEMGGVDIVLDDGSHVAAHQRASFDTLFPLLETGGIYAIEDLHTAYWRDFGGGYESSESFVSVLKLLIDDMHHWYHSAGERIPISAGMVGGVHVHDSIAIIEKRRVNPPQHSQRSGDAVSPR